MQVVIHDLNPFLPEDSAYESQVQVAFAVYANSISELASNSLQQNQIRTLSGEVKNYKHWNYPNRSAYAGFLDYEITSDMAMGYLFIAASIVAVSLLCAAFVSFPTGLIITLIGFPIHNSLNLRRQAHSQWEEFQIQTVLDAQEYYVQGPLQRGQIDTNLQHQISVANLEDWCRSILRNPTQENQEIMARCVGIENFHQIKLRKIQAVHEKFVNIKAQNPQKAARIVISLFRGIHDYELMEFQRIVQERFDELSAQGQP